MSEEQLDPRMEALFREAQGREDVYRFRQVLREVAAEVEARERDEEISVIPIWRRPAVRLMLAASVVALVVLAVTIPYFTGTDHVRLAVAYAERSDVQVRGSTGDVDELWSDVRAALVEQRPADALSLLKQAVPVEICDQVRRDWFTALALLMQGREQDARKELDAVATSGCQEKALARELLRDL